MPVKFRLLLPFLSGAALVTSLQAQDQQRPVVATVATGGDVVVRAEAMVNGGHAGDATELLGRYLTGAPNDGRAWFFLGRIYLAALKQWHVSGHTGEPSGPLLTDMAGVAFDQAAQLLTDSGGVYRTLISVERATAWVEEEGWRAMMVRRPDPAELPLPPIIAELGRNLIASCPSNGVVVMGSEIELAGVWGVQLLGGSREDLVLLRPDRYRGDPIYRWQMSKFFETDSSADIRTLLSVVKAKRPICLTPSLDTLAAPSLGWKPSYLLMVAGGPIIAEAQKRPVDLSVHQLSRLGLAGSVWSAQVRDLYEAAARFNPSLCRSLFTVPDSNFPSIASCRL